MTKEGDNSFGILAVTLGILSLVLAGQGILLGILGIIFGFQQRKRSNNKWASWGIGLSIAGILVNAILFFYLFKIIGTAAESSADLLAQYQNVPA